MMGMNDHALIADVTIIITACKATEWGRQV